MSSSEDRNIYLSTIAPAEAVQRAKDALDRAALIRPETVPAHESCGRVTSAPIFARCSSPTFHAAAMDGIAVSSSATFAAREGSPVTLKKGAGFVPVNTGHSLPDGMDAVVMIEQVEQMDEDTVRIESPAFPWQHVRRIGEDIVATELLLPQNHTLSPYDELKSAVDILHEEALKAFAGGSKAAEDFVEAYDKREREGENT